MSAPDRIYGWQDGPLSVARFYGGCTFNGTRYRIDITDPDAPLLRVGVPTKGDEAKAIKATYTAKARELKKAME